MNNMMTLLITKLFGKKAGEDHLGNKYFYRLVKNNKEKIGYSSIAMIFPEKTRKQDKEEQHHYPGIVLLIKEV